MAATANKNYDIGACFHEVQALGQASPSIIQKEDPRVAEVLGRAAKGHKHYDASAYLTKTMMPAHVFSCTEFQIMFKGLQIPERPNVASFFAQVWFLESLRPCTELFYGPGGHADT